MKINKDGQYVRDPINSYGSSIKSIDNVIKQISTEVVNNDWIQQMQGSSLHKLLFNNGYYNAELDVFYPSKENGYNPDIMFVGKIHQDYIEPTDDDKTYMETIKKRMFIDVLGVNGLYLLTQMSKALMGDMMKKISFGLGTTDCGKSMLCKAIQLSCGDYIGSFNAESLAFRNSSNDEAQNMRWAMLLRYKRIIFSNEIKSTVDINGNMLKKISSGGDDITGRTHGKEEMSFKTHFMAFIFANDLPDIKPYDPANERRAEIYGFDKQFVAKSIDECNAYQLPMDAKIETEITTKKFQKAMVWLLMQSYRNNQKQELIKDASMDIKKKEWIQQDADIMKTFLCDYDITNDTDDYITSKEIIEWLSSKKLGVTIKAFSQELKKYSVINGKTNIINKNKKIKGKSTMVWVGITPIIEEEEIINKVYEV
jgi:phage/plasmid-associated DNA primase